MREFRPRTIFVPYAEDAHPDHIAASRDRRCGALLRQVHASTEMTGEPFFPERVYRYMAVHMRVVAEPSFIVDVTEDLPTKLEALAATSRSSRATPPTPASSIWWPGRRAMWGALGRVGAGEPFFALEPIAIRSVTDLI